MKDERQEKMYRKKFNGRRRHGTHSFIAPMPLYTNVTDMLGGTRLCDDDLRCSKEKATCITGE